MKRPWPSSSLSSSSSSSSSSETSETSSDQDEPVAQPFHAHRALSEADVILIECGRPDVATNVLPALAAHVPATRPLDLQSAWLDYLNSGQSRARQRHPADWTDANWQWLRTHSQLVLLPPPTRGTNAPRQQLALVLLWHQQNALAPDYAASQQRTRLVQCMALLHAIVGANRVRTIVAQTSVGNVAQESAQDTFRSARNGNARAMLLKWHVVPPTQRPGRDQTALYEFLFTALHVDERWCNGRASECVRTLVPDIVQTWERCIQSSFHGDTAAALRRHATDPPLWIEVGDAFDVDALRVARLVHSLAQAFVRYAPPPPPRPRPPVALHLRSNIRLAPYISPEMMRMLQMRPLLPQQAHAVDAASSSSSSLDPTPSALLAQWRVMADDETVTTTADAACDNGKTCSVCLTAPATVALIACGHLCLCRTCCRQVIRAAQPRCPLCKAAILGLLRVFST